MHPLSEIMDLMTMIGADLMVISCTETVHQYHVLHKYDKSANAIFFQEASKYGSWMKKVSVSILLLGLSEICKYLQNCCQRVIVLTMS